MTKKLDGVVHLYFETGSEGTHWAFQENQYIQKNVPRGYCKNCGVYFADQKENSLNVSRIYSMDQLLDSEGNVKSEEEIIASPTCPDDRHEEYIGDSWDYKGLHLLENDDQLTIYSIENPTKVEWEGKIKLIEYPPFKESAHGMWINSDQEGVNRESWAKYFVDQNPASLIKAHSRQP